MWYRNLMLLSAKVNRLNLIARCAAAYGALNMVAKALVVRFIPGIIQPMREGAPDRQEHPGWPVCSERWHGASSPRMSDRSRTSSTTRTLGIARTRVRTVVPVFVASLKPKQLASLG